MGQSALIFTLAATFTIVIILIIVSQNTRDTDEELAQYHYKVLAREVASTGLNMTVRRLVAEPYQWSTASYGYTETAHRSGTFTTTVTPWGVIVPNFYGVDQDTVTVVSVGSIPTTGGDTTHVIEARYVKGYEDFGLPPAFKKAMFAEKRLELHGGTTVSSADPTQNASIHADGELVAVGNPVEVDGYGTVSDGSDCDPACPGVADQIRPNELAIFEPNDPNPDEELVHYDAPISLPPIDAYAMYSDKGGDVAFELGGSPNTYTLSGDTLRVTDYATAYGCASCGTEDNPLLIYVDGDLDIGNLILEGFVQFVVTGSITFNGSVTVYTDVDGNGVPDPEPEDSSSLEWEAWMLGQLDNAENTTIGYYSEGSITANGNFSIVGQLYANGDVTLNGGGGGEVNIIGGVISQDGDVTANGGVNIRFAMIHESTLLPGLHYIVPEGVRLIAYAEW
jgi:hypothetical protein